MLLACKNALFGQGFWSSISCQNRTSASARHACRGQCCRWACQQCSAAWSGCSRGLRTSANVAAVEAAPLGFCLHQFRRGALLHLNELIRGDANAAGRAAAAAGQSGLMALYDSLFGLMDCQAAQVRTALPLSGATCSLWIGHAALSCGAACNFVEEKLYWQGTGCLTPCCTVCKE